MGLCATAIIRLQSGLVRNESDYLVHYYVYDYLDITKSEKLLNDFDPNFKINATQTNIEFKGLHIQKETIKTSTNCISQIEVRPGHQTSLGLRNLKPNQCKWSLTLTPPNYSTDPYFLFKDVVIHSEKDIRITIQNNFSFTDLHHEEIQNYLLQGSRVRQSRRDTTIPRQDNNFMERQAIKVGKTENGLKKRISWTENQDKNKWNLKRSNSIVNVKVQKEEVTE